MPFEPNLFWTHPAGDPGPNLPCAHMVQEHPAGHPGPNVPCTHLIQQHPAGHPGPNVPCTHMVQEHPAGHPGPNVPCTHMVPQHTGGDPGPNLPCAHMVQEHPGGHPGPQMPCMHFPRHNPAWHPGPSVPCAHMVQEHPGGHPGPNVPCTHLIQEHPGGHPGPTVPCTHMIRQHPGGDPGPTVPCAHMVPQHTGGDPGPTVPCAHMIQQHPGGHPGPNVPCVHPLAPAQTMSDVGLVFYTSDPTIISAARAAALKLRALGVEVGKPRPLLIFNHAAIADGSPSDQMWSHYNRALHAIQLMQGDGTDVLLHEMGHATTGHSCVFTPGGGAHTMYDPSKPGVAMSEGWAHFVALAIRQTSRDLMAPGYRGISWETRQTLVPGTTRAIPLDPNIEYNVACTLWDLFDTRDENPAAGNGRDQIGFEFNRLYEVFGVTPQTFLNGPVNWNLDDYLQRLKNNNPGTAARVDEVRRLNCG